MINKAGVGRRYVKVMDLVSVSVVSTVLVLLVVPLCP